ncbi:hypothetical protein F5877DRAFT_69955 [Lentinula edodes]|nr:hypothetical protein F5877DRAFT_69955 [Lentinula edodes]
MARISGTTTSTIVGTICAKRKTRRKVPKRFKLILCHLDPGDLLRLSRASKGLRNILLSRTSESIWRVARENFIPGLPRLPMDMNEPQYARLFFDMSCYVCNNHRRCDNVFWRLRIRCCLNCTEIFPMYSWELLSHLKPFPFKDVLPREKIKRTAKESYHYIYDQHTATEMKRAFVGLKTEEDRHMWINQKKEELQELESHAQLCEAWHKTFLEQRRDEIRDIRRRRMQSILDRLDDFGLREEAQHILSGASETMTSDKLTDHPLVKQPKQLTDRDHKIIRLKQEHHRLCRQRYSCLEQEYIDILCTHDLREPYPGVGDILTDATIEDLIWNTALDEMPRIFSRAVLSENLPRIIKQFRCCHMTRAANTRSHERMQVYDAFYDTVEDGGWGKGPWSSRFIFFHAQCSQLVEQIVTATGLDPAIATIQDLTVAHPMIERPNQHENGSERLFMTWPAAVRYALVAIRFFC